MHALVYGKDIFSLSIIFYMVKRFYRLNFALTPNFKCEFLTPSISACDYICRYGLLKDNLGKMKSLDEL